jgi:DNA polymerase-3 subunit beta
MKSKMKRADLARALAAADGVAKPNKNSPLLECVLVCALGKDAVTVEATDTSMTIATRIDGSNSKSGSIALSIGRLRDVVNNAPGDEITIEAVGGGWVELKCGKASYKLAGLAPRDMPKIPRPAEAGFAFDGGMLGRMIDRVLFSVCDDQSRFHLASALLDVSAGIASLVSTDGHRLSIATCASDATLKALIPKDALKQLAKILDEEATLSVEGARLFATIGETVFSTLLVDAVYPPYEQVRPKSFEDELVVDRLALIDSIKRTKIATSDTRGTALQALDGSLRVQSAHPDVGEVSDEIDARSANGARFKVAAMPKYLLEPLAEMTDEQVKLKYSGELSPIVIEGAMSADYTAIVMPMRLP